MDELNPKLMTWRDLRRWLNQVLPDDAPIHNPRAIVPALADYELPKVKLDDDDYPPIRLDELLQWNIERAVKLANGNLTIAARAMGVSRWFMYRQRKHWPHGRGPRRTEQLAPLGDRLDGSAARKAS